MVKQRILMLVPGILNFPFESRNWDPRMTTWCNKRGIMTDRGDYFCGPISRAWHQQRRVQRIINMFQEYPAADFERTFIAHSNGCDLVLQTLAQLNWPEVESLHLISGACQADFEKNGLNYAIAKSRKTPELGGVKRVHTYVGGKDVPMRIARTYGFLVGFGTLGLKGPVNATKDLKDKSWFVTTWPEFGHSTCFSAPFFDQTAEIVTAGVPQQEPIPGVPRLPTAEAPHSV